MRRIIALTLAFLLVTSSVAYAENWLVRTKKAIGQSRWILWESGKISKEEVSISLETTPPDALPVKPIAPPGKPLELTATPAPVEPPAAKTAILKVEPPALVERRDALPAGIMVKPPAPVKPRPPDALPGRAIRPPKPKPSDTAAPVKLPAAFPRISWDPVFYRRLKAPEPPAPVKPRPPDALPGRAMRPPKPKPSDTAPVEQPAPVKRPASLWRLRLW